MAVKDHLSIERGATYRKTYLYVDSDGNAISLAAYEGRMQIRETVDSTTAIVSLTSDPAAGITIELDGETGRVDIEIAADVTEDFTFNFAVFDLELYDPIDTTEVIRLVEGLVTLNKDVTR